MGIGYAVGNVMLAAQEFENWPEVMLSIAKKQEPTKIILKDGLQIEAAVGLRFLVREIFFAKTYNPPPLSIGPNDIVIDIGANCGVFTLFAASSTKNKVYAFEPAPGNFPILQRNIAVNGLSHVIAQRCAVSDKEGMTNLFLNPQDGQQNLLSEQIIPEKIEQYKLRPDLAYLLPRPGQSETHIQVPTTTLQAIIDDHQLARIDFLKLDCEGAEGAILASTPPSYLKKVRKLAMEFHDHLSPLSHNDLQALLKASGFTTRLVWDGSSPLGYLYGWQG